MKTSVLIAMCACGIGMSSLNAYGMDPGLPPPPILDEVVQQVRAGVRISTNTVQQSQKEFWKYFSALQIENDVQDSWSMLESDRINYFMAGLKLSILSSGIENYRFAGSHVMKFLYEPIKRRRLTDDNPFLTLCFILPAADQADFDGARAAYKELLEKDPFLARYFAKHHKAVLSKLEGQQDK